MALIRIYSDEGKKKKGNYGDDELLGGRWGRRDEEAGVNRKRDCLSVAPNRSRRA